MSSQSVNSADASDQQMIVFPPDRGIGVLAVVPPYPVGYKPQTDGALGININLVHSDRDGLQVYILAYIDMSVGDTISVYIESKNAPVAEFPVTDAHFDEQGIAKNIPFYISAKDMESRFAPLQKQNKDFWFEVTRISGNTSEGSPPVPLFYKYPAPGEADTDGGKPFNQGLKLPVASESVVDKTVIDEGMFVTVLEYFNQHIGDVVVLALGSLLLETTVTELGDVLFELLPEQLATLAPTNSLVVRWEVFDVVENASGWSDSLILTFKPGVVLLTAPIFEQADADNVLHHNRLIGGAANVLVTGVFSTSDVIDLTLQGFTKGGDPVIHIYSQTLAGSSRAVSFSFENERVRNLIGGTVRATYTLTKAGKAQQSKPADATIAGTSLPLGAPIITPLVDGKLPVDTLTATVQVADYWPLKSSAKVELRWQTTDQDGIITLFIFALIVTDPTQPVVFKVPARYIAPYANTPLTVQNAITNPGQVEVFSELAQLMFGEETAITLLPPFPVSPATNLIDPLGPLPTLRVEFLAAQAEDRARLIRRPALPGSPTFEPVLLNQNKRANFVLNRALLVANQGTTLDFAWNLRRNNKRVASSPALQVTLQPIAEEDQRLPTPRITDIEGVIDVNRLTSQNVLVADEWPGQVPEQARFLSYEGTDRLGQAVRYDDLEGEPTDTESGLRRPLPLAWLINLKNETDLTIKFSVVFRHGAEPILFPRQTYRVAALVELQPTITSIQTPEKLEIPHKGPTIATSVIVEGQASTEQPIEILVDGVSRIELTTKADGSFSSPLSGFSFDVQTQIKIRALYGNNLESLERSFVVHRPLQVNQAPMALHGYKVYTGWPTTGLDFLGNTEIRLASFGVPPVTYTSSNTGVAVIDGNGKVSGQRNGDLHITVQDRFSTLSYPVSVRNVFTLAVYQAVLTHAESVNWMNSVQGSIPMTRAIPAMHRVYGGDSNWPLSTSWVTWMCDNTACPPNQGAYYVWRGGGYLCRNDLNARYWAWCLRPY